MSRVERSLEEKKRIGMASDQRRIDVLERLLAKLIAFSVVNGDMKGNDLDKKDLSEARELLDQLDIDHPDPR